MPRYNIINRLVTIKQGNMTTRGIVVAKDGLNLLVIAGNSILNVKLNSVQILK
jgi:hypothetical protein